VAVAKEGQCAVTEKENKSTATTTRGGASYKTRYRATKLVFKLGREGGGGGFHCWEKNEGTKAQRTKVDKGHFCANAAELETCTKVLKGVKPEVRKRSPCSEATKFLEPRSKDA